MDGLTYNDSCTNCARHKECQAVCIEGLGNRRAKLMIVSDSPTKIDDEQDTVLSSAIFSDILEVVGINRDDVYITYAVKCYSSKDKPTPKEVKECSEYLKNEVLQVNPTVVLALGELSSTVLCNIKKLSSSRGKFYGITLVEGSTIQVLPTYSPYYVDNTKSVLEVWANDILRAFNMSQGVVDSIGTTQIVYCDTIDKVKTAIDYCKATGVASFDFETPAIDKYRETFAEGFYATTLSLSFQIGSAYVIPLEHQDSPYTKAEVREIMNYLKVGIFENPAVRKIAHNLKYDCHICRIYGITNFRGRMDDTMLMYHLINELEPRGLKALVSVYLPEFAGYEADVKESEWHLVPMPTLITYNGTDTDVTLRLCIMFEAMLQDDKPLYYIYRNLTMSAFKAIFRAEVRGMDVDREYLRKSIKEVDEYIAKQVSKLRNNKIVKRYEMAMRELTEDNALDELRTKLANWRETHSNPTKTEDNMVEKINKIKSGEIVLYDGVNFGSPKQLQDLLYFNPNGFNFTSIVTSTSKDVLEAMESQDSTGFIKELLALRSMEKMQGTYLKGIYQRLDNNDRVHTTLKLDGTASGRLSSANPNLQNMPNPYKLTDELLISIVKMVKKSFIPPKGKKLIQIDFAQAELRVIASFARESNMIQAYVNGEDLHAKTGSKLIGVENLEEFYKLDKKEQKAARQRAKAVNFGLIYGMSAKGFQEYAKTDYKLELTLEEAEATRDMFFDLYPYLLDYHETYRDKARKFGWVRTLFGRRRRTPDINSSDDFKRSSDERVAINSPIQGTAGEMTVMCIALLNLRLPDKYEFINTIHDSIMFYVPEDEVEEAVAMIKEVCEHLPTKQYFNKSLYKIGMAVDAEASSESWADLQEI